MIGKILARCRLGARDPQNKKRPAGPKAWPVDWQQLHRLLLLPVLVLALAEWLLLLGDRLSGWSETAGSIVSAAGRYGALTGPVLLAAALVLALAWPHEPWLLLTALVSSQAWLTALVVTVARFRPELPAANPPFAWLGGLLAGLLAPLLFSSIQKTEPPTSLNSWQKGSRLLAGLGLSLAGGFLSASFGLWIGRFIEGLAERLATAGSGGLFLLGLLDRLLAPFGLQVFPQTLLHQVTGSFITQDGGLVHGDLNRFLAADARAGALTAGLFPMMLLVVPALLLAGFVFGSLPRKKTWPLVLLVGLSSVLGGMSGASTLLLLVFSPLLYLFSTLLSGFSFLMAAQMQTRLGFVLGPGLIDLLRFWSLGENPQRLLLAGSVLLPPAFLLPALLSKGLGWLKERKQKDVDD